MHKVFMLKSEFNEDIEFADEQHVGYGFIGVVFFNVLSFLRLRMYLCM